MVPASSADVRMILYGRIETVLHMEPVMTSLMTRAGVSTVFHPMGNTANQRQVIKT